MEIVTDRKQTEQECLTELRSLLRGNHAIMKEFNKPLLTSHESITIH